MKTTTALLGVLLAGCAYHSGIQPMGPDTYSVSVEASPARGGQAGAQRIALTDANEKCQSMGKEILVINMSGRNGGILPVNGGASITFRCLDKGDPDLQRPVYNTTVIRAN